MDGLSPSVTYHCVRLRYPRPMFSRPRAVLTEETRPYPGGHAYPPYRLKRSPRRRGLALRVDESGQILLNAPARLGQSHIDAFLLQHAAWVGERLRRLEADRVVWREGAALPWLGGELRLEFTVGVLRPRQEADRLHLPQGGDPAALVIAWYRRQARPYLLERLAVHAARAGIPVPPLRLSDARTRWGSLSAKGVVSLNWRLMKAPPELIDYVICHELAHFRQRNHSPAFWREVEALYPDWRRARAALRGEGRGYFRF